MTLFRRAVPDPAVLVVAPARDAAAAGERAGAVLTGRDRLHSLRKAGDRDRLAVVSGRAVPELAPAVVAPALDAAAARERARVTPAGRDRLHPLRKAGDSVGCQTAAGGRAVPELAGVVGPPALDGARARERAGVRPAGGDRLDPLRKAGDSVGCQTAAGGRAVPELAGAVGPPALDGARARERAAGRSAGGDRLDPLRKAGDSVGCQTAAGGRAVPELAGAVVAPALDRACTRE